MPWLNPTLKETSGKKSNNQAGPPGSSEGQPLFIKEKMISIIIPLYNEESLVNDLLFAVHSAMDPLNLQWEMIVVDDGSRDGTLSILKLAKEKDKHLRILCLSRNFGHQAAFTAGLEHASGDLVVMMDGDLQDPPALIPQMMEKLEKNALDVVLGRRTERNEEPFKRWSIKLFHKIFDSISGLDNAEDTGNFCIMRRPVVDALLLMKEQNRYLPGLRAFVGFKKGDVSYERPDRLKGNAAMGFRRLLSLAGDAIFSFSRWPVKLALYLGLFGVLFFLMAISYTFVSKIMGWAPLGWSSTFLTVSFFGSVQLVFLGIIGEYVYRIYKEVQNRPLYIVKESID